MEVENAIIEDLGNPVLERSKDLRGRTPRKYDGTTPLPDALQEEYIHRIVYNMGNRKKAYEQVYYPNTDSPKYSARAPYRFFERKGFMLRYNYLMSQAMYSAGLDKKTLLLKTADLLDKAVKGNKVRDFTSLVDTVLKLQVDDASNHRALGDYNSRPTSRADLKPVEDLLAELNG